MTNLTDEQIAAFDEMTDACVRLESGELQKEDAVKQTEAAVARLTETGIGLTLIAAAARRWSLNKRGGQGIRENGAVDSEKARSLAEEPAFQRLSESYTPKVQELLLAKDPNPQVPHRPTQEGPS